jgi:hypothetical protein
MGRRSGNSFYLHMAIVFAVAFLLFHQPLLSGQPVGLDTLGHLSKVSYIKQYPFANWDMSWYSGTLFLKLYSPLFYYLLAIFPATITAANFLSFLGILLTSLGIYLIVSYTTRNGRASLFGALGFLTVLSTSYYWVATGNLPYVFALWTLPFSFYFLERAISEKSRGHFILFSVVFAAAILSHIVIGFLVGFVAGLRFIVFSFSFGSFRKAALYCLIPLLMVSFWFVPFLSYSDSSERYEGYVPNNGFLFGFGGCCWGLQAGGIGVMAFLFLPAAFLFLTKGTTEKKHTILYFLALLVIGFLLLGGLKSNYPFGVDPVRFVLPFSVVVVIFTALSFSDFKIFNDRRFLFAAFAILAFGLVWSASVTWKNFDEYSYYKEGSRYMIIQDVISDPDFPIKDEFTNHRFGTSRYVFGQTMNYFMPSAVHTFGYQDMGMLDKASHRNMLDAVWISEDIWEAIYYLDWFGVNYFEGAPEDSMDKFREDGRFKVVGEFRPEGYSFTLFEYLDAKGIISLVEYLDERGAGGELESSWGRDHPDAAVITYLDMEEGNAVIFREFYHKTWKAKDLKSGQRLDIARAGPGLMAVYPASGSEGVMFYQHKTAEEILGLILTLLGVFILFIIPRRML